MGWLIFAGILFVIAMFLAMDSDGSALFIWALCFLGTLAIFAYFLTTPTAMDLHSGKAVIKYEIVDGVKVDSTFVFREK